MFNIDKELKKLPDKPGVYIMRDKDDNILYVGKAVILKNIGKTVIYDEQNNEIAVIDGGYLDIGINDTIKDLFVNFIGALVFSIFAYIGLRNNKNSSVVKKFVPTKEKRKIAESVKNSLNI